MAYFSAEDLIDAVRYEFGLEDETGIYMKIVPPPTRRPKPGGLPLDFRNENGSVLDDEQHSPNFLARPEDLVATTAVETWHLSKTSETEKSSVVDSARCSCVLVAGATSSEGKREEPDFLQFREVPSVVEHVESLTMKLVLENTELIDPNLAAYAKFESTDPSQGRKLLVFFPFAKALPEERYGCALNICVYPHTSISDLIGLCCYVYMRNHRKPEIREPERFQMLMAEDNGEIDYDLPAIDGHRLLSNLGSCWSTVAIVLRSSINEDGSDKTKIVVYTVNGMEYEFFLESLDVSLRWLRDEALKRRKDREGDAFISEYPACEYSLEVFLCIEEPDAASCFDMQEYVLEAVHRPNVTLNLDATIGSTAYTDFLMLRKNSSRGSFQLPLDAEYEQGSPLVTPMPSVSGLHSPRFGSFGQFFCGASVENGSLFSSVTEKINVGTVIEEFLVDRLHRYKPKSAAKLSLCKDGFELKPDMSDRRRSVIFPVAFEKPIAVLWSRVGTVEVAEHNGAKRILKIVWVPPSETGSRSPKSGLAAFPSSSTSSRTDSSDSLENDEASKWQFSHINEKSRWKTLQLELALEDAYSFVVKANEILDARQPQTKSLYKASAGGKRKPSVALEAVVGTSGRKPSTLKVVPRLSSTGKRSPVSKPRSNKISRLAVSIQKIWNRDHSHE